MSAGRYNPSNTPETLVAEHEAQTTDVHGFSDTSEIIDVDGATALVSDHNDGTEDVHGIADTAELVTRDAEVDSFKIITGAAPADETLAAGELVVYYDDTDAAGKLEIKAKTADGTVVTGEVVLA